MRILVVQTGFLGDIILSSAVWTNLRLRYPDAHLAVLTTPEGRPLVESHEALSEVIVFDKRGAHSGLRGLFRMAGILREKKFDQVYSLHKSARTSVLLALARIPVRYGFREAALSFLYTDTVRRKHLPHEALRNLVILQAAGESISKLDSRLSLGLSDDAELAALELLGTLAGERLVGIAPGSVWATKRWTVPGFAAVAEEFLEMGYRVVLIGGPRDIDTAASVEKLIPGPVLNLVGKADLQTSAAVISRLRLLITNDSAPLHIASACGTPVVALFCATIPEFGFGPWQVAGESVGVHGLSCRPCGRHGGQSCPTGTHACQLKLKPETVMDAALRVIDRTQPAVTRTAKRYAAL